MGFPRHGVMVYEARPDTFPTRPSLPPQSRHKRRDGKAQARMTQKLLGREAEGRERPVWPAHVCA